LIWCTMSICRLGSIPHYSRLRQSCSFRSALRSGQLLGYWCPLGWAWPCSFGLC
jgi:hypothetical protein